MKTTVVIGDRLFARVQKSAKARGLSMRELIEEALRNSLALAATKERYVMPDCSVGDPQGCYPLAGRSWEEVRDLIYGASDTRTTNPLALTTEPRMTGAPRTNSVDKPR